MSYRIVYGIVSGYITAWLAPSRAMLRLWVLGAVGLVLSILGVAANWNKGPEFGPKWFSLALVATALPCAFLGGKLQIRKSA